MALADAGYTRTEIAAKLDLLYHRVAGVLKRGGRQMPNQTAIVQSARSRALNKARGEATRVKVRDLDDQGRRRAEIAAELGLSLQCVAQVLSDAGRGINAAERIARSRATRKAQSAALRAEILALDDLGRSRQEIAAQLVRSKCKAVSDSLEEAGDRLFTFTRLPPSQWKSARTTNAIERLHEEFKRRIKTQTVLPSAETAAMLFWALLASGQITMRKVDGWQSLTQKLADNPIDLAA